MKKLVSISVLFVLTLVLISACDQLFDFSPYEANVAEADKNQTLENLGLLYHANENSEKAFSFAAIADSHIDYADLEDAVNEINSLDEIDFVVHLGDMTHHGWLKEFEIFSETVNRIEKPFLTCIGNHEYLANGEDIYQDMFGEINYSIIFRSRKLIFFDAATFESNKQPDMNWFEKQLIEDSLAKIILSHIPPWDDHYSENNMQKYKTLLAGNNVILSMHGHHHSFYHGDKLNTEVNFLLADCIKKRTFLIVTIFEDNSYTFELVPF